MACKENLGKFAQHFLPGLLKDMAKEFGWATVPRNVVHDKASYMVCPASQRLNVKFANALKHGGLKSWVGGLSDPADWMTGLFGDVYVHETLISRIRRLLDREYPCQRVHETVPQL